MGQLNTKISQAPSQGPLKEEGWSKFVRGKGSSASSLLENLSKSSYIIIGDNKFKKEELVLLRKTELDRLEHISELTEKMDLCIRSINNITEEINSEKIPSWMIETVKNQSRLALKMLQSFKNKGEECSPTFG